MSDKHWIIAIISLLLALAWNWDPELSFSCFLQTCWDDHRNEPNLVKTSGLSFCNETHNWVHGHNFSHKCQSLCPRGGCTRMWEMSTAVHCIICSYILDGCFAIYSDIEIMRCKAQTMCRWYLCSLTILCLWQVILHFNCGFIQWNINHMQMKKLNRHLLSKDIDTKRILIVEI